MLVRCPTSNGTATCRRWPRWNGYSPPADRDRRRRSRRRPGDVLPSQVLRRARRSLRHRLDPPTACLPTPPGHAPPRPGCSSSPPCATRRSAAAPVKLHGTRPAELKRISGQRRGLVSAERLLAVLGAVRLSMAQASIGSKPTTASSRRSACIRSRLPRGGGLQRRVLCRPLVREATRSRGEAAEDLKLWVRKQTRPRLFGHAERLCGAQCDARAAFQAERHGESR